MILRSMQLVLPRMACYPSGGLTDPMGGDIFTEQLRVTFSLAINNRHIRSFITKTSWADMGGGG